jgi:glycosyltransferase involved in cell wall biosynthesis
MFAEAANTHTRRWVASLIERGWEVDLVSVSNAPIAGARTIPFEIPGFGWRYASRWPGRYLQWLREVVEQSNAGLLHVHFLQPYPLAQVAAGRVPIVISTWGADIIQGAWESHDDESRRETKTHLLRSADAVTATTRFLADQTARYAGIEVDSIDVIPFGVNLNAYDIRNHLSPAGGGDTPAPTIGFLKHLLPKYGPDVAIRALPKILRLFPNARLLMIGQGGQEQELRQLGSRLSVSEHITWVGFIPHEKVPAAFGQMDVYLMPSVSPSETFGVTAVEAQAAGVPVVFSDQPGVREAVTHGEGGLAVPPGDPDALATAVCRLLASRELRQQMGRAGRTMVEQRFDFQQNVDAMISVYQRVLQPALAMER